MGPSLEWCRHQVRQAHGRLSALPLTGADSQFALRTETDDTGVCFPYDPYADPPGRADTDVNRVYAIIRKASYELLAESLSSQDSSADLVRPMSSLDSPTSDTEQEEHPTCAYAAAGLDRGDPCEAIWNPVDNTTNDVLVERAAHNPTYANQIMRALRSCSEIWFVPEPADVAAARFAMPPDVVVNNILQLDTQQLIAHRVYELKQTGKIADAVHLFTAAVLLLRAAEVAELMRRHTTDGSDQSNDPLTVTSAIPTRRRNVQTDEAAEDPELCVPYL